MKKLFVILLILLICFSIAFANSIVSSDTVFLSKGSLDKPVISTNPDRIPGGKSLKVDVYGSGYNIVYGMLNEADYWGMYQTNKLYPSDGEAWDLGYFSLYKIDGFSGNIEITKPGKWYVFAMSEKNGEVSTVSVQYVEIEQARLGKGINIDSKGVISGLSDGIIYASLHEDMSEAILLSNGIAPTELLGENVYLQVRGLEGYADSEVVLQAFPTPSVNKPSITVESMMGGKQVIIQRPSLQLRGSEYVENEEIDIFYTIDGTDPVAGVSEKYVGNIEFKEKGYYVVKALAYYKKGQSDIVTATVRVDKVSEPTVYVSGLDIFIKSNDDENVYFGYSKDAINILVDSDDFLVLEEDVGSTIFFQVQKNGYASSDILEFEVESLTVFQDLYSMDDSRQFGNWRVEGAKGGGYAIIGRFDSFSTKKQVYATARMNGLKVSALFFTNPVTSINALYDAKSWFFYGANVIFEHATNVISAVHNDFFIINGNLTEVYFMAVDEDDYPLLFTNLNSGVVFEEEAAIVDTVSVSEALEVFLSGNNAKRNDTISFSFSSKGFAEALNYYLQKNPEITASAEEKTVTEEAIQVPETAPLESTVVENTAVASKDNTETAVESAEEEHEILETIAETDATQSSEIISSESAVVEDATENLGNDIGTIFVSPEEGNVALDTIAETENGMTAANKAIGNPLAGETVVTESPSESSFTAVDEPHAVETLEVQSLSAENITETLSERSANKEEALDTTVGNNEQSRIKSNSSIIKVGIHFGIGSANLDYYDSTGEVSLSKMGVSISGFVMYGFTNSSFLKFEAGINTYTSFEKKINQVEISENGLTDAKPNGIFYLGYVHSFSLGRNGLIGLELGAGIDGVVGSCWYYQKYQKANFTFGVGFESSLIFNVTDKVAIASTLRFGVGFANTNGEYSKWLKSVKSSIIPVFLTVGVAYKL